MHVLAVAPYVPYEGVPHAGGEYLLRHLQAIARAHTVTLVVPGSPEAIAQQDRAPAWLDLVLGPMAVRERGLTRVLRDAAYRRLMAAPPAPTAESLRAVLDAGMVERARRADVVELHWPEYARFATVLRRAGVRTPVSVVEHDVDLFAVARRVRQYLRGYRRVLGLATAPLVRRIETRGLSDADLVLVFKAADERLLRDAGIDTAVRVIDPWLDEPARESAERVPRSVLFAAALWRQENEEGALWFLNHVWPDVRVAVPDATCTLAGAGPSARLRAAAAAADVEVTGEVPSLLPYYGRAALFVAPLFVGGGLKFKIPQAMLCGLPVVATGCAAQGVVDDAPADTFWAVTDDPPTMTAAVVAALRDPARAESVGRAAQRWCRDRYSFTRSVGRVLDDYADLVAHIGHGHPRRNEPDGRRDHYGR